MINGGIKELLFTSDNSGGLQKQFLSLPDGMFYNISICAKMWGILNNNNNIIIFVQNFLSSGLKCSS